MYNLRRYFDIIGNPNSEDSGMDKAEDEPIRKRYTCPPIDPIFLDILRLEGKQADDIGASYYVKRYFEKPGIANKVYVDALLELYCSV